MAPAWGDGGGPVPGRRSALIVATYAYDDAAGLTALRAPRQDAEALSKVLGDPEIGGFEVRTVINQPSHVVTLEVARFFADRRPDDLLLLHFSCHGVKDDAGELYFAATDTRLDLLEASAVSAAFVNKVMDRSRSSRVVLLLDCCYAGAFARGMTSRGGPGLDLQERLGGRGRAVITASTSLQFSFEDGDLADGDTEERPSVFTRSLVEGLTSGEADRDQDGIISLDELYGYVYDSVTTKTPNQTPSKWAFGLEGDLHIARRSTPVTVPSELPPEIEESIASSIPWHRESVVPELERLLRGSHPGRALAARLALQRLCDDDSRQVATHALSVLASVPQQRTAAEAVDTVGAEPRPAEPDPPDLAKVDLDEPDLEADPAPSLYEPVADEPAARETTTVIRALTPGHEAGPRSRAWWPAAAIALVVLVVAGVWWVVGRGDGSGQASASSSATLPRHVLVLARATGQVRHLVQVDAGTGRPVPGMPSLLGRLPSVSPHRDAIVYIGGRAANIGPGNRQWTPYIVGGDLTHPHPLLPASERTPACQYAARAAWRTGQDDLLVLPCKDGANQTTGLQLVTREGRLVGKERMLSGISGDPTWTGAGTVVFARVVGAGTRLFELPGDLSGEPRMLFDPADPSVSDSAPDWSEQGLLFLRSHSDAAHVSTTPGEVMLAKGGQQPVPVHHELSHVVGATWSPDGTAIAYLVPVPGQQAATLRLFDHQHGKVTSTSVSGRIGAPAWGSR